MTIAPPDLSSRPFRLQAERKMTAAPADLFRAWTQQIDRWFAAPGTVSMTGEVGAVSRRMAPERTFGSRTPGLPNPQSKDSHEQAWPLVLAQLDARLSESI